MMRYLLPLALGLTALSGAAQAACFVDYKAKQDDPLRLHYGVAEIRQACDIDSARTELEARLTAGGWQLLQIEGLFDEDGLEERQANAGEYYLRF